ncbi:uncharacterized protein PV07_09838 [Cladophialophora immunda]|uniref:L-lactate dehydrogenase (Cytochrome) n=1 Tax=Cladophialophora immunda TaxID=569365 RepID=A0A0D2CKP2_9EURO|nr:uncharacterized protein PV07_09838 [Cladophialophora immunda]KIW24104.1 hypothetical protein PV07_09838 [Cladophialophora immunda]OQU99404.1 hypothetical protein CLAIMM_05040 [Cladophialophora immunda]
MSLTTKRRVAVHELKKHATGEDGWIALNGTVWDFSDFAAQHPGGAELIVQHLGKDGSEVYNEIHSPALVQRHFGEQRRIGELEASDSPMPAKEGLNKRQQHPSLPPLESITSLHQFEAAASPALTRKALLYLSGATEDGITERENRKVYSRVMFRPRLLQGVGSVNTSTQFLGLTLSCPIMVAPTSSNRLFHRDGEVAIARASQRFGVPPIAPTMGSFSLAEISEALGSGRPFFFQLYANRDRSELTRTLDEARRLGARAIMVTSDSPVLSKRESAKGSSTLILSSSDNESEVKTSGPGSGPPLGSELVRQVAPPPVNNVIDPDLNWADIQWIARHTGLPVFVKGIQRAEDAKIAAEIGCAGIYLSNHGGRALDTTPPAILVLLEIQKTCPEILTKMEVIVDGGVRRGTDVLKAICLGARAVCVGRPCLYALAYGENGVLRALAILKEELTIAMQLLGITSLDQANPGFLNTSRLEKLLPSMTLDSSDIMSPRLYFQPTPKL